MSCGIRVAIEVRRMASAPPASWSAVIPFVDVDEVSNRTLFALLAGYPSWLGLEPLWPPRGLPSDITQPVKDLYDEWHGAAYDGGWVSYEELVATVKRLTTAIEDLARQQAMEVTTFLQLHRGVSIDAVIAFLDVYRAAGFQARMVFWFTPI